MDHPAIAPQTITTTTASPRDGGAGYGNDHDGGPTSNPDPTIILKRKRTKRQRPTIPTHSSPTSFSHRVHPTAEDELDIDTANCLILLSQGHRHHHNVSPRNDNYKFRSKKYIQITSGLTSMMSGMYVYECKTCSRTFSSFQALGGHRASHYKKPPPPPPPQAFSYQDHDQRLLQLNHRNTKKSSSKLHQCSICGSEFNSGQALGGHMRRHRAANGNTTTTTTTLSLIPYRPFSTVESRNDGLCLDLNLKLPAAPETTVHVSDQDQHREPAVRLSAAPKLVDCHY